MCGVFCALENEAKKTMDELEKADDDAEHGPNSESIAHVNGRALLLFCQQGILKNGDFLIVHVVACVLIWVPPCVP